MTQERDSLRAQLEQQRHDLASEFNERKAQEVERITKELEAKLEAKNQLIIAEIDRKSKEEREKKMREDMIESQQ